MTSEEAIAILIREKYEDPFMRTEYREQVYEALNMAIKALEQEPCEDAISRQAAIDTIESWLSCDDYNNAERHIMRAMQSVLYDLPSVKTQEPYEDWYNVPSDEMTLEQARQAVKDLRKKLAECLKQEPCEDEKQRTGHWIMSDDGLYRPICNNCGAHPWKGYIPTVEEATKVFKYCPNCGCRMVEPQERSE